MMKSLIAKKDARKAPVKSMKEKRAAKKAKKSAMKHMT
jgi:hypothetical protein